MDLYKYDWEPHTVTTEDGYILTTFNIKGKEAPTKSPIIFNHGLFGDAMSWVGAFLETQPGEQPYILQLVDQGYDVWMTNNRGTAYSQGHKSFAVATSNSYWDFSFAEMGLYDDKANIKLVKEKSGKKPIWLGWSQGTTQLLYALAKEKADGGTFFGENLDKAVLFTPCAVPADGGVVFDPTIGLFKYQELGVYAINGPNWASDAEYLCQNLDEAGCTEVQTYSYFPGGASV